MNCPDTHDWDLLGMEALEGRAAAPLLAHLEECPDCRKAYGRARRSHLDRIRMYDQTDRGHDGLREQLMAALPPQPARSHADRLVRGWRRMGDVTMTIKHSVGARATIGLVSAAACITFAVLLTTFTGGRSALATAIERFQKSRTIVCRVSSSTPIPAGATELQQTGKLYFSAEYGSRYEMRLNGAVMIAQYTPPEGPTIMVQPMARNYTIVDARTSGDTTRSDSSPDAFIRALSQLKAKASRELGRKNLDGAEALGYEIPGETLGLGHSDRVRSELWVDARTYLPVRYLAEFPWPQSDRTFQMVYDQFEWDTPLDPQMFKPEIPADYTRIDVSTPATPAVDEAALLKGLQNYADLAGKYPSAMDNTTIATDFAYAVGYRIALSKGRGQKVPDQQTIMQKSLEIGVGLRFYQKLINDGCALEYHGKTVSPGQADAVLLRWKLADGQWRVIYGDLRTDTVNDQ
jgi:hypothetical protein